TERPEHRARIRRPDEFVTAEAPERLCAVGGDLDRFGTRRERLEVVLLLVAECDPLEIGADLQLVHVGMRCTRMDAMIASIEPQAFDLRDQIVAGIAFGAEPDPRSIGRERGLESRWPDVVSRPSPNIRPVDARMRAVAAEAPVAFGDDVEDALAVGRE